MDLENRLICIGYPSPELIDVRFHTDLLNLATQSSAFVKVGLTNAVSSRIVANRNLIVENARIMGATDILWIDSDQKFPVNGLVRLLNHEKEIVCATTCRRKLTNRAPIAIPVDRASVKPFQKLVPMRFVGLPFMLTSMSVFDKMEKPYFAEPPRELMVKEYGDEAAYPYENLDQYVMPEDEYFCFKVRQAGFDIWCDMELTMEIGHIGSEVFYVEQSQSVPSSKIDLALGNDETEHRAKDGIGE